MKKKTLIDMQVLTATLNTYTIPTLNTTLESELPGVLRSTCFNEQNLPFAVEVMHTEIGHLFEHILLEYLCQCKIDQGCSEAMYRGVTNWDWTKDSRGLFHISISAGIEDIGILQDALDKTIALVNRIMQQAILPREMLEQESLPARDFLELQLLPSAKVD